MVGKNEKNIFKKQYFIIPCCLYMGCGFCGAERGNGLYGSLFVYGSKIVDGLCGIVAYGLFPQKT